MKVELKQMRLRNFKGVADATFDFGPHTVVRGTNGTGKTTLVDAYNFCLFGKDSKGRTDSNFKRRNPSDNFSIMHDMEYSVEVVLLVDGVEKRFERTLTEKWTRKRGENGKTLTGHESMFYIDRVKCATKREFDLAVAQLASEESLRMMTDPSHFIGLKDDVKKSYLLRMAYGTSDADEANKIAAQTVVDSDSSFDSIAKEIGSQQVEEFIKCNSQKIRAINKELSEIPIKIASKKEVAPAEQDWSVLESIIAEQKKIVSDAERQIESIKSASTDDKAELARNKCLALNERFKNRRAVLKSEVDRENNVSWNMYNTYQQNVSALAMEEKTARQNIASTEIMAEKLSSELDQMRKRYAEIKNGQYQFSQAEMMCPTCHRPYDVDKLREAKLAENKEIGKRKKGEYDSVCQQLTIFKERLADIEKKKSELGPEPKYVKKDIEQAIMSDPELTKINAEYQKYTKMCEDASEQVVIPEELLLTKREAESKVVQFTKELGQREVVESVNHQIEELEERQKALNAELAKYEKLESDAVAFQKAKDDQLISRVNGLFKVVSWDFISEQLNGSEKLSCNCYVDGIPFAEKNRAGQINAGLDIINAICKMEGMTFPIFVDNAESIVDVFPTASQQILLSVDSTALKLAFEIR